MSSPSPSSAILSAFRWILGLGAVAILVFWGVYRFLDPGYYDPLAYRLGYGAFLLGILGLTFVSETVREHAWYVVLAGLSTMVAYFTWLGAVNGFDAPWLEGVLVASSAAVLAVASYARTVTRVWVTVALVNGVLTATIVANGIELEQSVLLVSYSLTLSVLIGVAAVVQVKAHEALRAGRGEIEARSHLLRTVIDAIPEHVYVKDREGRCLVRNAYSAERMGYASPEDAVGLTVFDTSEDPEVAADYWAEEDRVMTTGEAVIDYEEPYAFDGEQGWIMTSRVPLRGAGGEVVGLVGVTRDVTGQKRARAEIVAAKEAAEAREREIKESQRLLRTVIDTIPDAIFVRDREGRCVVRNRADARFIGYDRPEETVGLTVFDTLPEVLAREVDASDRAVVETGEPLFDQEDNFTAADGRDVWLSTAKVPLRDEQGVVVGLVGVSRDVTEQKRARAEIVAAKEAAEAATRAKSEFLANMSHEIRTPMNGVIGMTSLLLDTDLDREQRDFVETIRTSGDSLLTIINDILDFSKIEAGMLSLEVHPFEVRPCVEEALDLVAQTAAEKGVELAYLIEDGVPGTVRGDVTRVRQVLVNLLSNAVKFTAEGSVCVRVHAVPPDAADGAQTEIHFSIEDTGIGIALDKLALVFESFSQADASTTRQFGGTGLGLTICRRLVEMMGGEIGVESEVGLGSTFRFSVAAEVAPSERRVFLRREQPALQGRRVLVVDDNDVNREILTRLSQRWRMRETAVASGPDALAAVDLAAAEGRPFDLVLLDMQMPGMDGIEVARALRDRPGRTPVTVMLTSIHREGTLRRDAEAAGVHAVLYKPTKPSQLYDVLINAFEEPAEAPAAWVSRPRDEAPASPAKAVRILLAEDNAVNQKVAVRLLGRLGYTADVVANGAEALAAVRRQPYDVVFMDVQMPEMDGLEATRRIRAMAEFAQPTIIALTANAMDGDREACLEAGADDYLSKPVNLESMALALEQAVEQRALAREAA